MPKNNVAGNSGIPLSVNQYYRERSDLAPKQRNYRKTKQIFFFFLEFFFSKKKLSTFFLFDILSADILSVRHFVCSTFSLFDIMSVDILSVDILSYSQGGEGGGVKSSTNTRDLGGKAPSTPFFYWEVDIAIFDDFYALSVSY